MARFRCSGIFSGLATVLRVAWWRNGYGVGLATQRVAVRLPAVPLSGNDLRQVVHTHVPLSPSSAKWHRSEGDDALRLGR